MLEYIYTNRVKDMLGLSADEVIKLLALANGEQGSERALSRTGVKMPRCCPFVFLRRFSWRVVAFRSMRLAFLAESERKAKERLVGHGVVHPRDNCGR